MKMVFRFRVILEMKLYLICKDAQLYDLPVICRIFTVVMVLGCYDNMYSLYSICSYTLWINND